jgi:hypothetical protein
MSMLQVQIHEIVDKIYEKASKNYKKCGAVDQHQSDDNR